MCTLLNPLQGVTLEDLERVKIDAESGVEALRGEYLAKIEEMEGVMNTFKRIAFMMDDIKINQERIQAKVHKTQPLYTICVFNPLLLYYNMYLTTFIHFSRWRA
jgi:hypothetical protein